MSNLVSSFSFKLLVAENGIMLSQLIWNFNLFIFFISCGFGFDSPLSTFDAQGPVAQLQKDLFLFVFWLAVIVFFLVEGAILYASYKYRQKDEKLPAQIHGNTKLELMWTVLPSIIIAIIDLGVKIKFINL